MKTDVPLKRLTRLRPMDLLPLLGASAAEVIGVETLELPAAKSSLDTVLRLRDPEGQEYLHLVEWQGYTDRFLLWRTLGYLAWLGQNQEERPILATIIYLTPADDVGTTLTQAPMLAGGWTITLTCVRLWEQDAAAAVASRAPGLLALAPLMGGATGELVEQAAQTLIRETAQPEQGELLAALGIFAEPILGTERFIRLVTKERLMTTDLIAYLFQDKVTEFEQREAAWRQAMQRSIEDVIATRFPAAPIILTRKIRQIMAIEQLQRIHQIALTAADSTEIERALELVIEI